MQRPAKVSAVKRGETGEFSYERMEWLRFFALSVPKCHKFDRDDRPSRRHRGSSDVPSCVSSHIREANAAMTIMTYRKEGCSRLNWSETDTPL
jgi:hypothetical protein